MSYNEKNESVITLNNVGKMYKLYNNKTDRMRESISINRKKYHHEFYALKDVNISISKGEIIGIIGKNGSGKSTLLKIISGILQPTSGNCKTSGRIVPLLELGSGFNPEYTGLENIYFYNSFLGYSHSETKSKLNDILDFAEIGEHIHQPLKTYSSGMKSRLAFAVAINVDPEILILDEILAVGDELFRRKCFAYMEKLFNSGKTILFVSHSINNINQLCNRAILLNKGEVIGDGPTKIITKAYQKLLYSKDVEIESIKSEICNSKQKNDKLESIPEGKKDSSYFIPDFHPKNTIDIQNENIQIQDIRIINENGNKVNCLIQGKRYTYKSSFISSNSFNNVYIGVRIKNEKGQHLAGYSSSKLNKPIENIKANKQYSISYSFICNLTKGTYYTNQGIAINQDGNIYYLRRIIDSYVFKVIEELNNGYTGIVDLNGNFNIS